MRLSHINAASAHLCRGLLVAALATAPMHAVLPSCAMHVAPPAHIALATPSLLADYAAAQEAKKEAATAAKAEARAAAKAATQAKLAAAKAGDKSKPVSCLNFGQAEGTCDAVEFGAALDVSVPKLSFDEKLKIAKQDPKDARVKELKFDELSADQRRKLEAQAAAAAKQKAINDAFEAKKAAKLASLKE